MRLKGCSALVAAPELAAYLTQNFSPGRFDTARAATIKYAAVFVAKEHRRGAVALCSCSTFLSLHAS